MSTENINQSETGMGDKKLSVELYVKIFIITTQSSDERRVHILKKF